MAKKDLSSKRRPIYRGFWVEKYRGIEIWCESTAGYEVTAIPWRSIRAALKRKDK